ncbi:hypothetical protein C2845_PM04G13970 [Panicum miliaceum]|uniref:Uncharacterized protein n=1 Tax=Panicum miliaceum TaxID=4540 RepID=A0A3L6QPM1_PANMI|nr:hypothetical protein C2845_PM04G13970 [Panicum miliaceum]
MARRRRTGRKALRDDPGAAARRTSARQIWRRATRPSWSLAPSHPRRRAGLEALRAAGVQAAARPSRPLAAAPACSSPASSDGPAAAPAHPRRQASRAPHLLARHLPRRMARPPVPPTTWVGAAVADSVGRRNLGLGDGDWGALIRSGPRLCLETWICAGCALLSACGERREQLRFGKNREQSEKRYCLPDATLFVEKKLPREREKTFLVLADLGNEKQIELLPVVLCW